VQVLLGQKVYRSHEMVYAGGVISCDHCGHAISGETKEKQTKQGVRHYVYYRCSRYHCGDHPRIRLTENDLDDQILTMFKAMRPNNPAVHAWLEMALLKRIENSKRANTQKVSDLKRLCSLTQGQRKELLNVRLAGSITDEEFAEKQAELREREKEYQEQIGTLDRQQQQNLALARNAPQVFQIIQEKWPVTPQSTKRRILEIIFTNLVLVGDRLVPSKRTPFELLAAG
jgi:hypothetical protein